MTDNTEIPYIITGGEAAMVPSQFMPQTAPVAALESFNFVIHTGAFHGPEHYRALSQALQALGHTAIIPNVQSDDITATYDTDTDVAQNAIGDETRLVLAGHSRGVEVAVRLLSRIELSRVIGVIIFNSGGPRDYHPLPRADGKPHLARHTQAFVDGIKPVQGLELDEYDYDTFHNVLAQDVTDEQTLKMAQHYLRRQRRPKINEAALPVMPPEIPVDFLLGDQDKVLNNEPAEAVAREYFGTEPYYIPGSHSPFLSNPAMLADLFTKRAALLKLRRIGSN
jgi:pimeloyl-ACP methyl ester carboxylesterase